MLGLAVLAPVLTQPVIAIALVAAVVGCALAVRSVAYPLALAGVPTLIVASTGHNPLPRGGVTLLYVVWIGGAAALAAMRRTHAQAFRALTSAPAVLSFVLLALMVARLGASRDQTFGSTTVQLFVADDLVFMLGAVVVGLRRRDLRLFFAITLAVAAASGLLLMFKLASGGIQETLANRFSLGAQEYPIYLGRDSADGLIIAIYGVLAATRRWTRLAAIGVIPLLLVALIASGSRGPALAFFFSALVLMALSSTGRRARRRLLQVGGALVGAAVVVPAVVPSSTLARSLSTLLGSASGLSTNGRSQLWAQALNAFAGHPVLGIGTGGFGAIDSTNPYPHNILLELAAELGVLGVLVFAGIVVGSMSRIATVWRSTAGRDRLDAAVIMALLVNALVNALFSGAIQDNGEIWVWAGLGLGLFARHAAERRTALRGSRAHLRDPGVAPAGA